MILRIVEPTYGKIAYRERPDAAPIEVTALSKVDLRRYHQDVRLIFQDPFASLNPRMTVKQIIGDPLVRRHVWQGDR